MTTRQDISSNVREAALLGTARRSFTAPQADGALGDLLSRLAGSDGQAEAHKESKGAEKLLLEVAAVVSLYEACGRLPEHVTIDPPAECESESMPLCPRETRPFFGQMLDGQHTDVLPESLRLAVEKNCRVFSDFLPALLDLGMKRSDLRDAISPALGERGRWLAARNSQWEWATANAVEDGALEDVWQTGSRDKRQALLGELRRRDASRARALLASTWEQEAPEDRHAFIRALEINLNEADESFLEAALDDRRKEVRRAAADLLARTPTSALVRRMKERVRPLMSISTSGIMRRKTNLEVTLPAECDKEVQRDGVELKPPHGIGEKAWWLKQMIGAVPPSFWSDALAQTPAKLVELGAGHEWQSVLLGGWTMAAARHRDVGWLEALWEARAASLNSIYEGIPVEAFVKALPPERCEKLVQSELAGDRGALLHHRALIILSAFHHPWSAELTRAVLTRVRDDIVHARINRDAHYTLRQTLNQSARHMSLTVVGEFGDGWLKGAPESEGWTQALEPMFSLLSFRRDMKKAFEGENG